MVRICNILGFSRSTVLTIPHLSDGMPGFRPKRRNHIDFIFILTNRRSGRNRQCVSLCIDFQLVNRFRIRHDRPIVHLKSIGICLYLKNEFLGKDSKIHYLAVNFRFKCSNSRRYFSSLKTIKRQNPKDIDTS